MPVSILIGLPHFPPDDFVLVFCEACNKPGWISPGGAAMGTTRLCARCYVPRSHEHPCPTSACIDRLRSEGFDIDDSYDCCICWREDFKAGLE